MACADASITLFTAAGRRAAPSMRPCRGGVSALAADLEDGLLAVGAHGDVVVWRGLPQSPRCTLRSSAAALVCVPTMGMEAELPATAGSGGKHGGPAENGGARTASSRLLRATLLPGGRPLLVLPHGAFSYSESLQTWVVLDDEAFGASEYRYGMRGA